MSLLISRRSTGGCLTCKRRRKKCDETKPVCQRCLNGDFDCLGYGLLEAVDGLSSSASGQQPNSSEHLFSQHLIMKDGARPTLLDNLPRYEDSARGTLGNTVIFGKISPYFTNMPKNLQLNHFEHDQVISLILPQYIKHSRHTVFKLPFPLEDGLRWRASCSKINLWSMYLGARIIEDVSRGRHGQFYTGWINRFYQEIIESSMSINPATVDLDAHIFALRDLLQCVLMVSDSLTGYTLFRRSSPVFLRLAAQFPELWSNNSAIFISAAVQSRNYQIGYFVLHDTLIALALGTPPLINYDTTSCWVDDGRNSLLEVVYRLPADVIVLIAKINSWRVLRSMDQVTSNQSEWHDLEEHLKHWNPTVDRDDESFDAIARLAVQEVFRQALLIYLYMGMCEVNSADPRVKIAVRQVVQLVNTIETNDLLRPHLFIPCLIAGVVARYEKHRATIRSKIGMLRNEVALILRGADFVTVLDHLWHGAASGGRPVTWEDYVQSRCVALSISSMF